MGSEKCRCPPPPMEIPKWFVTYSDVITLLMTFFILLLTFASSEPEDLEKMQAATFGVPGASGIAGTLPDGPDKNSLTVRYRPSVARRTDRGSEAAALETTPISESASKGLDALENPGELASADRVSMESPIETMRGENGRMTSSAVQQLRMISMQMQSLSLNADLQVSEPEDIEFAVGMARYMQDELKVPSGRVSISSGTPVEGGGTLKIMLTRTR
jgi:chemotaxis protein MotB